MQVSRTARSADSFSIVILNNRESSRMYLSASGTTFLIVVLEVDNFSVTNTDKYP